MSELPRRLTPAQREARRREQSGFDDTMNQGKVAGSAYDKMPWVKKPKSVEPGTIKKSMSFVKKFLPLLGAAGAGGGAAAGGAAGAGAAGATAGQAAGAALNVASNLAESKPGRKNKALLHTSIAPAMRHAKKIAAHDRMLENFNPRRFDKPATVKKADK